MCINRTLEGSWRCHVSTLLRHPEIDGICVCIQISKVFPGESADLGKVFLGQAKSYSRTLHPFYQSM